MTDTTTADGWEQCPSGDISRLGQRLRGRRRQRRIVRLGGAMGVVAALVVGIFFLYPKDRPAQRLDPLGGLTHQQVAKLAPAYLDDQLPADLRARVERHVRNCDPCNRKYREMGAAITRAEDIHAAHLDEKTLAMLDSFDSTRGGFRFRRSER